MEHLASKDELLLVHGALLVLYGLLVSQRSLLAGNRYVKAFWALALADLHGSGRANRSLMASAWLIFGAYAQLSIRPSFDCLHGVLRALMGEHYRHCEPLIMAAGLTMRSSRNRFVPPNTGQKKLAICLAPLRSSA